jgi:hypothetical protein
MTTVESTELQGSDTISDLVNETLLLTAETLGLPAALSLRSELRALTAAEHGRVVLVSEERKGAVDLLARLLEAPWLSASLAELPCVRTTYRFEPIPGLTMARSTDEQEMGLIPDAAHLELPELKAIEPGVLQIDVALPSPFLSGFSITHLPDLHAPDSEADHLESITPGAVVVFVSSASRPVSVAETRFLVRLRERTERVAVVVTGVDTEPQGGEVLAVDELLLERTGLWPNGQASVFSDRAGAEPVGALRRWLTGFESEGVDDELLRVVRAGIDRLLVASPVDQAREQAAAEEVGRAEADLALVSREAMSWLPRLGYEFSRLRADINETVSRSLTALEQQHDDWIQRDVTDAVERLPGVLIEDFRALQRRADAELSARLAAVAHQFLAGRQNELVPGGLHAHVTSSDPRGGLVRVAEMHADGRNELFASLGNFGSGRQSIGLLSSVFTAVAAPVALVGGVIGLGFWQLGRRSRQEGLARAQASRWLKVQLAEAGRGARFQLDQSLNEAQLVLNLAVRECYDQLGQEARGALDAARSELAEATAQSQQERSRSTRRLERAERLRDRSREV